MKQDIPRSEAPPPAGRLGPLELRLLSWAQLKKKTVICLAEIAVPLDLTGRQALKLLNRLNRAGLILRIGRGVYLAPSSLPPGGRWGPDRYWVLDQFMCLNNATYQLAGLEAFNRYGLSTQIPNVLTVYNSKVSGHRMLGNAQFELIKVPMERLGGTRSLVLREGGELPFPTLARTLMDAVYDWSRFNVFEEAIQRMIREAQDEPKFVRELIDVTVRFGNIGTIRRIGYALESRGEISPKRLAPLFKALPRSKSLIPLNPKKPSKGTINTKWGVIVNE